MPELRAIFEGEKKSWPAATVFSYMMSGAEDFVLEELHKFSRQQELSRLTLEFDGIRIDSAAANKWQDFGQSAELHIKAATGYSVQLARKYGYPLLAFPLAGVATQRAVDVPPILLQRGNCIPLAAAHLLGSLEEYSEIASAENDTNRAARGRGWRTYREVSAQFGFYLDASCGSDFSVGEKYIVHSENMGNPHCVAVCLTAAGEVDIYEGHSVRRCGNAELGKMLEDAVDAATRVLFKIVAAERAAQGASGMLLGMRAGGAGADESCDSVDDVIGPLAELYCYVAAECEDYLRQGIFATAGNDSGYTTWRGRGKIGQK